MEKALLRPHDSLDDAQIWPRGRSEELLVDLRNHYPGYDDAELYCIWQRDTNRVELDRDASKFRGRPREWRTHIDYLKQVAWKEAELVVDDIAIAAACKARNHKPKPKSKNRHLSPEADRRAACIRIYRLLEEHPEVTIRDLRDFARANPDKAEAFRRAGLLGSRS